MSLGASKPATSRRFKTSHCWFVFRTVPVRQILVVNRLNAPEMLLQGPDNRLRDHRDTVFISLPLADGQSPDP